MNTKKVLVAGATGYLGQYLVKELKKRGYWVRVLIRKKSQQELFEDVDDIFIGTITQPATIANITSGIDWVFSTIGITRQKDNLTYMDVDFQGNMNLLSDALQHHVESFQYISAINGHLLRHLKIFEAKEKFVDALQAANIHSSIIRPNGFFSDMQDFLYMAKGGRVYLFGNGNFQLNPIHGEDLATACVNMMESNNTEASIGGPEILSQNDIAKLALTVWDKPIKITYFPNWTRLFLIWTLRTFTSSKTYGPIEFFLTAMANDNIAPQYGSKKLLDFFRNIVAQKNAQPK
ncbi:MAG: SDR family oxidoreductase [Flavobacteriales bacterium]|jgi:uncharacterized protein YbjT (DUF2867 family)|nr:SDR family oxidoreductase [Flavobacteriales bacterium]